MEVDTESGDLDDNDPDEARSTWTDGNETVGAWEGLMEREGAVGNVSTLIDDGRGLALSGILPLR